MSNISRHEFNIHIHLFSVLRRFTLASPVILAIDTARQNTVQNQNKNIKKK